MLQEEITWYLRENGIIIAMVVCGVLLCMLSTLLFQVIRTRREVHKTCKKVRKYFEVILTDESEEIFTANDAKEKPILEYRMREECSREKDQKQAEEARLLMDVIQEVF